MVPSSLLLRRTNSLADGQPYDFGEVVEGQNIVDKISEVDMGPQ